MVPTVEEIVVPKQARVRDSKWGYVRSAAVHGVVAWLAYAVVEFVFYSLTYRLLRRFAVFTTRHWTLVSFVSDVYLAAGLLVALILAATVYFTWPTLTRRKSPARVLEWAASLSVVIAFGVNLAAATNHSSALWCCTVLLAAAAVASIVSDVWCQRLGALGNPLIIAGLLLMAGRLAGLREMAADGMFLAGRGNAIAKLISSGVPLQQIAVYGGFLFLIASAVVAIWIGRKLWPRGGAMRPSWVSWVTLFCGGFLLAGSAWAGLPRSSSELPPIKFNALSTKPNLLLIVMDTVRADHMSVYGYDRKTTPNLKQLADDSTVYTKTISPSDYTIASHASIFSGMYAGFHGAHCQPPDAPYGQPFQVDVPTLAGILRSQGYRALGVAANFYFGPEFGLTKGFEKIQVDRPVPFVHEEGWYCLRNGLQRALPQKLSIQGLFRMRGALISSAFVSLLKRDKVQSPFFGFLNYMDAHLPYHPPAGFDTLYPGKLPGTTDDEINAAEENTRNGTPIPARYTAHMESQYDGGIAYLDNQLGTLIRWLKAERLYDNTMIVVTSDHGEGFGEHGLFEHGNATYQDLIHVALMVKYPHSAHKGVVDTPVSTIDIMPTALGYFGYAVPHNVQGRSLLDPDASRYIFSESFACRAYRATACPAAGCESQAVISWPQKYIRTNTGKQELYDLDKDPNETQNLFTPENTDAAKLSDVLTKWLKTEPRRKSKHVAVNSEDMERLRGLGYIQR